MQQRCEPAVDFAGLVPLAGAGQFPEVLVLGGEGDAAAGHPAVDAEDGRFQREIVHAGEDGVAVADRVVQVGDAAGVAGAFLERDEVLLAGQLREQLGREVVPVAERVVVDHDRQARRLGHGTEVVERFRRVGRLVDHRRHEHEAVEAELLAVTHEAAGFGQARLRHAAQDGHATVDGFHHVGEDRAFLLGGQGLVLAERPEEDQPGDARLDQRFGVRGRRGKIEGAVLVKLRGDGGKNAGPMGFHVSPA